MKGVYITVSGVDKGSVNDVTYMLAKNIELEGLADHSVKVRCAEANGFVPDSFNIRSGVVFLDATNKLSNIQFEHKNILTFNVEVFSKDYETAESLNAEWRKCPTLFPRLIVNSGSYKDMQSDIKRVLLEIGNWISEG